MEKGVGGLAKEIQEVFGMEKRDVREYSPLTLAYVGDAVYEVVVRTLLLEKGNAPVGKLHRRASRLVRAQAQAELARSIEADLSPEEHEAYRRGRNAKSNSVPRSASVIDYRTATGLEALIGRLYLEGRMGRILELLRLGLSRTAGQAASFQSQSARGDG